MKLSRQILKVSQKAVPLCASRANFIPLSQRPSQKFINSFELIR